MTIDEDHSRARQCPTLVYGCQIMNVGDAEDRSPRNTVREPVGVRLWRGAIAPDKGIAVAGCVSEDKPDTEVVGT